MVRCRVAGCSAGLYMGSMSLQQSRGPAMRTASAACCLLLLGFISSPRVVLAGDPDGYHDWSRPDALELSQWRREGKQVYLQANETSVPSDHHDDEVVVRIIEPWDGLLSDATSMVVRLEIDPQVAPLVSLVEVRTASDEQQQLMRVGGGVRVLSLHGVEPGTHYLEVSALAEDGSCLGQAQVMWDTVFAPGRLLDHRLLLLSSSSSSSSPPQDAPSLPPLSLSSQAHQRTRLCFVTSLKLDGQRMIYLQQLQRLPRDRYDMTVLNMQRPGREEDGRVFQERLAELGVPLLRSQGLSVSIGEAEVELGVGNVTEETVVGYALNRLEANGWALDEDIGPAWVRHVFESLVHTLRGLAPDILVFANGRTGTDALLAACARLAGVRHVIMELPNLFPFVPLRGVDVLIAPSHYAAHHRSVQALLRDTQQAGTCSSTTAPPPVVVITPGVDETRFHPLAAHHGDDMEHACHTMCLRREADSSSMVCDPDCIVVAFLGRLDPEKSPGLFLRMASLVAARFPSVRFQVIGYGSLRVALERRARRLGLGPHLLSFTGAVYQDLPAVLRTVGVLVNPSLRAWSETFCIANVEGMASGVPIVSYGVGGTGEYLRHDGNSLVVDSDDGPEALAEAVLSLLHDPSKRQRLALEARRTVLEHFTVDRQMDLYDQLYSHLPAR